MRKISEEKNLRKVASTAFILLKCVFTAVADEKVFILTEPQLHCASSSSWLNPIKTAKARVTTWDSITQQKTCSELGPYPLPLHTDSKNLLVITH